MSDNPYAPPTAPYSSMPISVGGGEELASRWLRFVGSIVDGFVLLLLVFPLVMMLGMALLASDIDPDGIAFEVISSVLGGIIGISMFLALNGYLLAKNGQTIGKYLVNTQIRTDDGKLMPFGPLILKRYVPLWIVVQIPIVGNLIAVVNAVLIFRSNRKCLHDDIAGTKVVVLRR